MLVTGLLELTVFAVAWAQVTANTVMGRVVRDDALVDQLIPTGATIEVLASGFEWTEGPVWIKDGGYLLFSDIPRNSVMKWKEEAGCS